VPDSLATNSLATIADYVRYTYSCMNREQIYFGHGTDNAWDESVSLVLQILDLPWDFSTEMWACRLTSQEITRLNKALDSRILNRTPLAYITKQAWFCEYRFNVDERVLIPRSPIAELIDHRFAPWVAIDEPEHILDLCTGSGCIGIASALEFESSQVDLLDISTDALDVAQSNIDEYDLQDRVRVLESDVFATLSDTSLFPDKAQGRYDLIISNPPYVDQHDFDTMPAEYNQEPVLGLVAGSDGLDIARKILAEAGQYLKEDGLLIVEVGNSWVALEEVYPDFPFTWVEFERGGHGVFVIRADELKSRTW